MHHGWSPPTSGLEDLRRLAEIVALIVRPGDVIALRGELGAGKTTLARALIRILLADDDAEVPSPTFPLVQIYDTPRLAVAHFDLYRLTGEDDLVEIGFDDALRGGLALVEWPERAGSALPLDRLDIELGPGPAPELRQLTLTGHGTWGPRVERLRCLHHFLAEALGRERSARLAYLQGDASARTYARVVGAVEPMVLMNMPPVPDGPPVRGGLPYSRIAHLAENIRPFVAVAGALRDSGSAVPRIIAQDMAHGFALLEDMGDLTFGHALADGHDQRTMWLAAVDTLVALRRSAPPAEMVLPDGTRYALPRFDRAALEIEIELILDWFWPAVKGAPAPDTLRRELMALWAPVLDAMLAEPPGLFLRDYHSPNLFWLPDRPAPCNVGVIDFQDALAEPWAYDLASLLQDARVDVSATLEREGFDRYCALVGAFDANFDRERFARLYAAFGAQRNTRLIGLWVRLKQRDGKPHYLQHMARTWDYLARNLAHPALAPLRHWYDAHFPQSVRKGAAIP
jgi:N-acetylmuramate 1-kinase